MKTNLKMFAMVGALAIAAPAVWAADGGGSTEKFMKMAIEGNLAEIQLGKLAQERGASDGVKAYGKTLEADHATANVNAVKTAMDAGVDVPTRPSNDQQATYKKLAKLKGEKFDKEFVSMMVDDHEDDVEAYATEAKKVEDGSVATYAAATLPVLQGHLQVAKDLKAKQ